MSKHVFSWCVRKTNHSGYLLITGTQIYPLTPLLPLRTDYTGVLGANITTLIITVLATGFLLALTHKVWLAWLGRYLIRTTPLVQADIVVVLSGDRNGNRLLKAVELVDQGFASTILITGPEGFYGARESDLAIDFARRQGLDLKILQPFVVDITSTLEETLAIDEELRSRDISRALVVTSEYHSRRANFILSRYGSENINYVLVTAEDPQFDPQTWWETRDGRKIVVVEYMKTLHSWFE
ncbi:MAG: hypothetical protein CMN58_01860 [Solibacterales bacterium]|nr:hypothetical protein [Bryobacterales bacterium]